MFLTINCILLLLTAIYLPQNAETAPSFTVEPTDRSVVEGDNTTLHWAFDIDGSFLLAQLADVSDESTPVPIGSKVLTNNVTVASNFQARFRATITDAQASLTILDVQRSDDGTYRLTIQNGDLVSRTSNVKISVQYVPEKTNLSSNATDGKVCLDAVLQFTCVSDASPPVHSYLLYKDNVVVGNSSSGVWNINMAPEGNSSYKCQANNTVGSAVSDSMSVLVNVPPVISPLNNQTVEEGDTVTLNCTKSDGSPEATITWTNVSSGGRRDGKTWTITNINRAEAGEYRCDASNECGNHFRSTFITVNYGPENIVLLKNVTEEFRKGAVVQFTCSATANPMVNTYQLYRNDTLFNEGSSGVWIITESTGGTFVYGCRANNSLNTGDSDNVTLIVNDPASISHISNNQTVNEGEVVTLNCTADGYPAPGITWTKSSHIGPADGNAIPTTTQTKYYRNSSASFPLNITGKQDEGNYTCTANNGVGTASKDVYVTVEKFRPFKTQLTTSLLNNPVKLNETFNITCIAEANPAAKYRFYRRQQLVFNDTSGFGVYTTHVSDRVSPVIYRCIPYNRFGDGPVNETTVTVHYPAKVTGFTITAYKELYDKGENLSITCQVEGNPKPGITWTKEGSDKIISRSKTLYVAPSLVTGRAVYNCTASNGVGAASSAKIDVQEATVIRLRMTLNGVLYSKNLTDLGSDESKNLTERIVPNISKAMNGTGLLEIMITKYGSGSVVVFFTLIFNQSIDGEMVILLLKNATSRGDFGDLGVDPSSIMLIQATEPPPSGETNCSSTFYTEDCKWKHLWTIIFVVLVVVVVLIVGVVVWWVLKIRKCRKKSPKVANTCTGEEGHVLQEFPDGAYAQVNQSYAKSGPAPANEYDQGAAGASAVPPVTYAVVDKSKKNEKPPDYAVVDKSKKKKKSGANEEKPPVVLKSQKKKNPEEPEQQYAQVDRSMKKKHAKPGEVLYADLGEFHGNNSLPKVATSPELLPPIKKPPPAYVETQYADITQFLKGDATLPPSDGTGGVTSAAATPPGEEAGGGSSHVSKL